MEHPPAAKTVRTLFLSNECVENLPMNHPSSPPPRPDDVHAWVDGRLPEDQRATLEDQLRDQPALLADAQEWKRLNQRISELHAEVLDEPLPTHLLQAASQLGQRQQQKNQWTRWGGMAASVLFAFGMGWFLQPVLSGFSPGTYASQQRSEKAFVMQASVAHAVFSPEVKHPVEVSAAEQQHLVQWLSKRLGRELKVPDLSAQGFQLMGGRLLSGDSGARAQFMFDNATGKRVTLYVGGLSSTTNASSTVTSFQFSQQGKNLSFYWVDRNFGYALTGDLDRPALMTLSEAVYAQLPR